MENPSLRVQMFQLNDSLPALKSKPEIARQLKEYLGDESVELPQALKGLLNFTSGNSLPDQMAVTTLSTAVETLAQKYISDVTPPQALKTIEGLRKHSIHALYGGIC